MGKKSNRFNRVNATLIVAVLLIALACSLLLAPDHDAAHCHDHGCRICAFVRLSTRLFEQTAFIALIAVGALLSVILFMRPLRRLIRPRLSPIEDCVRMND